MVSVLLAMNAEPTLGFCYGAAYELFPDGRQERAMPDFAPTAGDRSVVLTGKGAALKGQPLPADYPPGTHVHEDLAAFAEWLITSRHGGAKPA